MSIASRQIPERMREGIAQWITHGEICGSFLIAVFENDLTQACLRADEENAKLLWSYAMFVFWDAPSQCHGSKKACDEWQSKRRKDGPIDWRWPT